MTQLLNNKLYQRISSLVADEDAVGMETEKRRGAVCGDITAEHLLDSLSLFNSACEKNYLACLEDATNSHGERVLGNVLFALEEA